MDEEEYLGAYTPSHTIYEGKKMIYIKNNDSSNCIGICKDNFEISYSDIHTIKYLSQFIITRVYGILGIINFKNTPCLVFGIKYELRTIYFFNQAVYKLEDIHYLPLINYNINIKKEIEKEFEIFKEKILKTNLFFSYPYDLSVSFYQQSNKNINSKNSFFFNYEMAIPLIKNKNIKKRHDFYTKFIDGYFQVFKNDDVAGQEILVFYIFRKINEINYYECELIMKYENDLYDFTYGILIGNEHLHKNFLVNYGIESGIIFNCTSELNSNESLKKYLPNFSFINYDKKNLERKYIKNFIEEQNKEIKKIKYFYTFKDPLTGKISNKYRQHETTQDGIFIFICDNIEIMTLFNIYINRNLVFNFFSNYQKENDFESNNDTFIDIRKIEKNIRFINCLKLFSIEFNDMTKNSYHFIFKNNLAIKSLSSSKNKNKSNLKIFIGTFNTSHLNSNQILKGFDENLFLFPKQFTEFNSTNNLPDILCISFEEIVELNVGNILISSNEKIINLYISKFTSLLCKYHPYILKLKKNLVGILTLLFVKSELNNDITHFNVIENKTGILGLGNKGNYIVTFNLKGKYFSFVTGHLSAGDKEENFEKRVNELKDIFSHIITNEKKLKKVFYFITGDLNFRIDLSKEKLYEICGQNIDQSINESTIMKHLETLKKYDQMNKVKQIFEDKKLSEEKINFAPTYKYIKGTKVYDNKRIPSWTDRILFKEDKNIKCKFYDTINLCMSDHKPLVGLFEVNLN